MEQKFAEFGEALSLLTCILLGIADRLTKTWASSLTHEQYAYSWLSYQFDLNLGVSWGIGAYSYPVIRWALIGCNIIFFGLCCLWYARNRHAPDVISHGLIWVIVGAASNIYDRLYWGGVVDFIVIHIDNCAFPTFNIADMMICVGAVIMWYGLSQSL